MADPITHIFLGMAIYPQRPVIGAMAAIAPDGMQLVAAIKLKTTDIWKKFPADLLAVNDELHLLWYPVMAFISCLYLQWFDALPIVFAFGSHVVLDMFTHDYTSALKPFVGEIHLGMTFHSIENMKKGTWWIVLLMIGGSLTWSILTGAWR